MSIYSEDVGFVTKFFYLIISIISPPLKNSFKKRITFSIFSD
jgi:hypothetical protein